MWLVPDLNFVAIRISDVQVRFAGTVLAVPEDRCSYGLGFLDGRFDVVGRGEAEAKVVDPARQSVIVPALEGEPRLGEPYLYIADPNGYEIEIWYEPHSGEDPPLGNGNPPVGSG